MENFTRYFRNTLIIQLFIFTSGLILSSLSAYIVYQIEEKAIVMQFQKDVSNRAESIYRQIVVNLEVLYSLSTLFEQSHIPDNETFSNIAKRVIHRHPDIQALEWIPKVDNTNRSQFIEKQREFFPQFEITERKEQGLMIIADSRELYFPVAYLEPYIGNEAALGFDLASSAKRKITLTQSLNSGEPLATASINLVQSNTPQKGFLAFLPVYDGMPNTVSARQDSIKGFVLGAYRICDIFQSSNLGSEPLGIEMHLIDDSDNESKELLHLHKSRSGLPNHSQISHKIELPPFWRRNWTLVS